MTTTAADKRLARETMHAYLREMAAILDAALEDATPAEATHLKQAARLVRAAAGEVAEILDNEPTIVGMRAPESH